MFVSFFSQSTLAFTPSSQQLASVVQIFSQLHWEDDNTYENDIFGSGFFIDTDGTIMTNAHVVLRDTYEPYDRYVICLTPQNISIPDCRYIAKLLIADDDKDIALLRLTGMDIDGKSIWPSISSISWGNSDTLQLGQEINILGYPDAGGETITFTKGSVSGFVYDTTKSPAEIIWIKTDAKISEGNSGGEALDSNGAVIGIPTLVSTNTESIGFLLPVNILLSWKNQAVQLIAGKTSPLIVKTIPSDINDLDATAGDTEVTLSWSPSFSSDGIQYYEVTYDTSWMNVDTWNANTSELPNYFTTTDTEIIIPNLANETEYYFYIRPISTKDVPSNYWSNEAYATPTSEPQFKPEQLFIDVNSTNKNFLALLYLKNREVIEGYKDGSFQPDQLINRAELLKLLVAGQRVDPNPFTYKNCFPDVHEEWYAASVCYAKEQGWVQGYPDKKFRPATPVNRVESLKMIVNAYKIPMDSSIMTTSYGDIDATGWYFPYVSAAEISQMLEERSSLSPDRFVTRANIAENIYRAVLIADMFPSATVPPWKTPTGDSVTLQSFFPLSEGKEWTYNITDNENTNTTSTVTVTNACNTSNTCFTVKSSPFSYQYEKTPTTVLGTTLWLNDDENNQYHYIEPETVFSNRNHVNYFRLQTPLPIQSPYGNYYYFFDGVNKIELVGFEDVNTTLGIQKALKVHKSDTVRSFGGEAEQYDYSQDMIFTSEGDSYYVEGIGLVKRTATITLRSGDETILSSSTEEVLSSYKE